MKYRRVLTATVRQMLRPCRRNLALSLLIALAFIPLVVFVVDHLTSSPPALADVDIQVVVVEEHHEGITELGLSITCCAVAVAEC